jgi:hypothetical protein
VVDAYASLRALFGACGLSGKLTDHQLAQMTHQALRLGDDVPVSLRSVSAHMQALPKRERSRVVRAHLDALRAPGGLLSTTGEQPVSKDPTAAEVDKLWWLAMVVPVEVSRKTPVLRDLERRGYVTRKPLEGAAYAWSVTDRGRSACRELAPLDDHSHRRAG